MRSPVLRATLLSGGPDGWMVESMDGQLAKLRALLVQG